MNGQRSSRAPLPYPGLRPFRRDEATLFFGRENCIDEMVDRLAKTRFLAVLGASGTGKSSLVYTGLLDGLSFGLMADAEPSWQIGSLRPGGAPITNLARALLDLSKGGDEGAVEAADPRLFAALLRRSPVSVLEWCRDGNLKPHTNLLIVVDQFEELFRYRDYAGQEEAESFVALLIESARCRELPIYVVITMRSEYLGPCALIPGLAGQINAGLYLTRRMTREETREAIEGPAEVCDFAIEAALVNRLLNDLASFAPWEGTGSVDRLQALSRRADQLPLMQHVLNRLWVGATEAEDGVSSPTTLRLSAYEALGGLGEALSGHADEVIASITEAHRPVAEIVFRALVSGESVATAIRRPCLFGDLVDLAGGRRGAVAEVVTAFSNSDYNFLIASPHGSLTDETSLDISHESLIRQWKALADWMRAEAKAAEKYQEFEKQALRWRAGKRLLLRGEDLREALAWWHSERPTEVWARRYSAAAVPGDGFHQTVEFLEQSERRWRRERTKRRILSYASVSLATVLILFGGLRVYEEYANVQGDNYYFGHGVRQDARQAKSWYETSAQLGYAKAQSQMGMMYEKGFPGLARDYGKALKWFVIAAGHGEAKAQYQMGILYKLGEGLPNPDYYRAMQWFRKALHNESPGWLAIALHGGSRNVNLDAEDQIGLLYLNGQGVKPDSSQALSWFQKAAHEGSADASYNIGVEYLKGEGVQQDYVRAMNGFMAAADQGASVAEDQVGLLYLDGKGVKQDYGQAMTWFQKAAAAGSDDAKVQIALLYVNANGVQVNYRQAMSWFLKAEANGSADAEDGIAELYLSGQGVAADSSKAMTWFLKAAHDGSADAAEQIGFLFLNGNGVPKDYQKAMKWFEAAAHGGSADAEDHVGYRYLNGEGVAQNYDQAMTWFKKAAADGSDDAEEQIALLYLNGAGVPQDYAQAQSWLRISAATGNSDAANRLGFLYVTGKGVPQDYDQAMTWFQRAAVGGSADAEFRIGLIYLSGGGTIKQDYASAIFWLEKAAAHGSGEAMEQMGLLYLDDKAVKRDYGRAMAWFEQAARGGSADGEYHIAFRFLNGEGIPRDYVKAMTWFKKAVADGSALADDAEDQIAQLYANGEGVPVDYHAAKTWFEKAASDGSGDAEDQLGWFYLNGKGVDVSFGQALSWFQKAAADGSEDAADQIGYLYKTGHGVKQDDAAALKAFGQALEIARKNLAANPTDPGSMGDLAFQLLLNGKPQEALDTANKAIILAPNQIWIESNKADALMMLGETGAARDIYLRYRDVQDDGIGNPWKRDVRSDFDALRKLGVSDPLMAEVTDELAR